MLKRIDRYIIKKFLSTFFFMLGIIMLFSVVFDISEKLSEFISNKAPLQETLSTTLLLSCITAIHFLQ
jgi:lipopolysaccharide export system permease protein